MLIDLAIVLLLIGAGYRSRNSGFLRQFWASVGFFAGLFLGRWLEPHTVGLVHTPGARAFVTILTIFGLAMVLLIAGEYLGLRLKHRWLGARANKIDDGLGIVLSVASILVSVWLLAAAANSLPASQLKTAIRQSDIIKTLDRLLPPAPRVIANLGQLIDPNGFPDVFIGNEPIPRGNVNLPALGDLASAVNADKTSVVRLEGQGCGGIVSGSGFVVGNGLVATNAHVVAGIRHPFVQDINGNHRATVIWFDPNLDFAVLRVTNLAGPPLTFNTAVTAQDTPAAVLGYPGGGDFNAKPAAVLDQIQASGHNIYGTGNTLRAVYEIQADIIPGNSGGPLVAKDGKVIGVVFAESTTYQHVGYALAAAKVSSEAQQASHGQQPVSTGQCAE